VKIAISAGAAAVIAGAVILAAGVLAIVFLVRFDGRVDELEARVAQVEATNTAQARRLRTIDSSLDTTYEDLIAVSSRLENGLERGGALRSCLGELVTKIQGVESALTFNNLDHLYTGLPSIECSGQFGP
jgi:hypothetical protein